MKSLKVEYLPWLDNRPYPGGTEYNVLATQNNYQVLVVVVVVNVYNSLYYIIPYNLFVR